MVDAVVDTMVDAMVDTMVDAMVDAMVDTLVDAVVDPMVDGEPRQPGKKCCLELFQRSWVVPHFEGLRRTVSQKLLLLLCPIVRSMHLPLQQYRTPTV